MAEFEKRPEYWMVAFLFIVTAGIVANDWGAIFEKNSNEFSGMITKVESRLSDASLVKCSSDANCPTGSECFKGVCVVDSSPEISPAGGITGAVVGMSSGKSLVECQTNFDCPANAFCKEGYCFAAAKSEAKGSCQGQCGSKTGNGCYCDESCERLGDCCPDFREFC